MKEMSNKMKEIPLNERFQITDGLVERQKNILTCNKKLTLELDRLRAECLKDVNSLIGIQQLKSYTDLHNELRAKFREPRRVFKSESEIEREEKDNRKKLVTRGQQLVNGLGVDKKKVKGIFKGYIKKADNAFDSYLKPKGEAPYVVADRALIPKPEQSPWLWFYPPYFSEFGSAYAYGSRGIYATTHYQDHNTGKISTISYLEIKGASDSDYAHTDTMSEIMIPAFIIPTSGRVEAWLVLRNDTSDYHGCMDDEWGWSDISVKQQSLPYMSIYGWNGGDGTLFDFSKGECDCCWSGKVSDANPGDLRFVHLVSQDGIAANLWAIISFGIHDNNYAWVNDYSVHMTMTNSWFVDSVAIRPGVP
jgi:hypothetical protein